MHVIGTAGHVDHGKSTLVHALTGIDPDRLREEKERGLTIDLGFAWLELPGGQEVSIVDVPGHERFIKNMLAGVGGIDLALLVVAADESVMPQTREHLVILDLLQIKGGVAVVTKSDLVDQDWLDLVVADVEEVLKGTTLEGSPVVTVSATTRQGLPELLSTLEGALASTPSRKDVGHPRLPIDRSFVISGFGTVVTGTLIDGRLKVGQEIELAVSGRRSRIRGLQSHKKRAKEAFPGSRVALNIPGIPHDAIQRGEVLTTPGWTKPTDVMDVRLRLIPGAPRPLRHNTQVTFHTGSSETNARVRLLETDRLAPGESGWAQIKLRDALPMVKGDYFVVRSPETTLGGGNVVDTRPRRHKRNHGPTIERLEVMEAGSSRDVILNSLESLRMSSLKEVVHKTNLEVHEAAGELASLVSEGLVVALGDGPIANGASLLTAASWEAIADMTRRALEAYHCQHRLRGGMAREELRSRLQMPAQTFVHALKHLSKDGLLVEEGATVRLPEHKPRLGEKQRQQVDDYLKGLEASPFSPPTDPALEPDLMNLLANKGRIVKVSENVAFSARAYDDMVDRIVEHTRERGKITVAEVRDMFQTSRKYALALMEHLDQRRITRRVGDVRVLR